MELIDVTNGFNVHEYRTKLKLLTQSADSMRLENKDRLGCPACDRPFEELLVLERDQISFSSAPNGPLCLVKTPDQLLVLTH